MIKISTLLLFILISFAASALTVDHVEPVNWWVGMKNPQLQLMVHGQGIAASEVSINYPGVKVTSVSRQVNDNFVFINLTIGPETKAGSFSIEFKKNKKEFTSCTYELLDRREGSELRKGFDPSDVIYLITPDRFANGNPANDAVAGMKELPDRGHKNGRHGGDLKGIGDHLDYLSDMGFTAIWLNPVLENNMTRVSYHGYSTTDFYKVDPRYGSNEEYRELADKTHQKGMKLMMDMIFNHIGSEHWWMNDMPSSDWLNYYPEYKITSHRHTVNQDPYVSQADLKLMTDGWFVPSMPDLNQRNPLMATYLIQNSIWWTEYLGLDGIRMDTYPYPDKQMMALWTDRMLEEYPGFYMVGEEWTTNPAIVSYWQKGKKNQDGYESNLPGLMDFPMNDAVIRGLRDAGSNDLNALYESIANDFQYPTPEKLVVFPDNHDMTRFYSQLKEDFSLLKMGIAYYATTRGIPQVFYGTEILMSSPERRDDGIIRSDFPGGWEGDSINGFTGEGLTDRQKEAQEFFRRVLTWRKTSEAVHSGKLLHFAPEEGIYTYFRIHEKGTVMVVMNKNKEEKSLATDRFSEVLSGYSSGREIITDSTISDLGSLKVPAMSAMIIELK
ncbi:MAG TPA: glycoside hydrolase family 13 protein [Prolixibacteraceae bacterium]|nr:glycoside hydrolase family 13 protein [Prolixibacteraceae bacterium]